MVHLKIHKVRNIVHDGVVAHQILVEAITACCDMLLLGYDEDYCPGCMQEVDWESCTKTEESDDETS